MISLYKNAGLTGHIPDKILGYYQVSGEFTENDFARLFYNIDSIVQTTPAPVIVDIKEDIESFIDPVYRDSSDESIWKFFAVEEYSDYYGEESDLTVFHPVFLWWCQNHLIPDPAYKVRNKSFAEIYNNFKDNARLYYLVYFSMVNLGQLESMSLNFNTHVIYNDMYIWDFFEKYHPDLGNTLLSPFSVEEETFYWYTSPAAGFWLRRVHDNSARAMFSLITEILLVFDGEWYEKHSAGQAQ